MSPEQATGERAWTAAPTSTAWRACSTRCSRASRRSRAHGPGDHRQAPDSSRRPASAWYAAACPRAWTRRSGRRSPRSRGPLPDSARAGPGDASGRRRGNDRGAPTAVAPSTSAPTSKRARAIPVAGTAMVVGILIGLGVLFAWRAREAVPQRPGPRAAGARRAALREPGRLGRRLLRRRSHRRGAGQAGRLPELSGDRPRQLERVHAARPSRPQDIARELGADYLLTGTVRWEKRRRARAGCG